VEFLPVICQHRVTERPDADDSLNDCNYQVPETKSKRMTFFQIKYLLILFCVIAAVAMIKAVYPVIIIAQEDDFGISEIYPSLENGTEWYSKWDNGHYRIVQSGKADRYDSDFEMTGDGEARINGEGIANVSGSSPRLRVFDIDFENVEITFYARRISEQQAISFQGFVAGARSKHFTDALCGANTYYGRFTYDGRVSFEKELFHGHGETAEYPHPLHPKYIWPQNNGIPVNEWIGFKFIAKTLPNEGSVLLELYRDLTDGKNGGNWEKVLEYKDSGDWYVNAEDGICGYYPHNKILFTSGFVFIRNDFVGQADYKKFSIREISN
jgi:hypothetical protein